jgi:chorismate lyase/3-hydroxybenzoate synthase
VYVLAGDAPGIAVENPRQCPSYRYSRRYGARPPCFARATRVGSTLFIGGTASIVGENSRHRQDIDAQTRETLRNIAEVIAACVPSPLALPLAALRDVRVHVTDPGQTSEVTAILREVAPDVSRVEIVLAELCRNELLVEIEGIASLA